jgi:DNA-binding transcriptional ArsR family regulator
MFAFNLDRGHNQARAKEVNTIPQRLTIARGLAEFLGALSHPHRILIVEELKAKEMDVNSLQQVLGIPHSAVSQNLAILRSHHLVRERKEGRRVIYALADARLAGWLLEGLDFLERELAGAEQLRSAVATVKSIWGDGEPDS